MTYIDDEGSVEDSRPRELYRIQIGLNLTYLLTSGKYDIVYNAETYTAYPTARTDQQFALQSGDATMEFTIALTHPLCARFTQNGIPPDEVILTVTRLQLRSGEIEQQWSGQMVSMSIAGHVGKFQVPSPMQRTLKRKLSTFGISRKCPYILYSTSCGVDPTGFSVGSSVTAINGRNVRVLALGVLTDNTWADGGDLFHLSTGVRRTIFDASGIETDGSTTLTLQAPILELRVGDVVTIRAGCNHAMSHCNTKYSNRGRFGGFPELPEANVFVFNRSIL